MADFTDGFKLTKAFFATFGKANSEASQKLFESVIKSGQNTRIQDVWSDVIDYCVNAAAADAWVIATPAVGQKYTTQLLTEVAGSNGQAWFIDDGGRIDSWVSPIDSPAPGTKEPSYGFEPVLWQNDGVTRVMPSEGAWLYDPYSGVIFFQEGYTPANMGYGIPRVTCYVYVGLKGSSGGGGSLTVLDEGVNLGTFTEMNFIGADVLADPAGAGRVNVYIPVPPFPSHFNTTDGNTNATVAASSLSSRIVSTPTAEGTPFKLGAWGGGTSHSGTDNGIRTHVTAEAFRITSNDGTNTITCTVFDADGVTILGTHAINLNGNYGPATVNSITMEISGFTGGSIGYSAVLAECTVDLDTLLPPGGHCKVVLVMNDGTTDYTYTQEFFYDIRPVVATISGATVGEGVSVVTRWLSGVLYYTLGSQFSETIADMDNLNADTYPSTQLIVSYPNMGLVAQSLGGASFTGWTSVHDNVNASHTNLTWSISITELSYVGSTQMAGVIYDWGSSGSALTTASNNCIDTFSNNASLVYEDFRNESRRLENDMATGWDSTQSLITYDGGAGLQVTSSRLIYPTFNYSTYNPSPGGQPNYSASAGTRYWYSSMSHTGTAHSNGTFELGDYNITEADITNDDFILEISLDNVSWFNCNEDYPGGPLVDGMGCRINVGVKNLPANDSIQFTLGAGGTTSVTTGPSGWGVYYRLTFTATDITNYLGEFQINDWA